MKDISLMLVFKKFEWNKCKAGSVYQNVCSFIGIFYPKEQEIARDGMSQRRHETCQRLFIAINPFIIKITKQNIAAYGCKLTTKSRVESALNRSENFLISTIVRSL